MGSISTFCPYKTHICNPFCRYPIYRLYLGYNYSYLMLTNIIDSSYTSDFFLKNVTYIEL